jgi:hypothetical protein
MSDQSQPTKKIKLRTGVFIFPSQIAEIEKEMNSLRENIPAKFILLVDVSGQVVTVIGDHAGVDTTALGSLIAGDLAASQEIARITGEFQDFQLIMREGEKTHIAISEAGPVLTFMVQFSKEVPLGWARRLIQKTARDLGTIMQKPPEDQEAEEPVISGDGLSDLFNDALDEIWKG